METVTTRDTDRNIGQRRVRAQVVVDNVMLDTYHDIVTEGATQGQSHKRELN